MRSALLPTIVVKGGAGMSGVAAAVPKTVMPGLKDDAKRADLVTCLATLHRFRARCRPGDVSRLRNPI
jgi:hypothetical protein